MKILTDILEESSKKAEDSELFYLKSITEKVSFDTNELNEMKSKQIEGMALRIKKNGKTGFATSSKFEKDIINNALDSSEFGDISEYAFSNKNMEYRDNYFHEEIDKLKIDTLIEKGESIIKRIREFDNRINVGLAFGTDSDETHILTSSGFRGNYRKNCYNFELRSELTRENDIFEVFKGYSGQLNEEREEKVIEDLLWDIENGMNIAKIERGKYPVIFCPDGLNDLISIFTSAIDGNKIYRKTSPLHKKLGEKIFHERLNIYDDGTIPASVNSAPFDDEGTISQKTPLVEKGVLKNFLIDLKNSRKLNMKPTGNALRSMMFAGRSYDFYPNITPTTVTIDSGHISKSDLMANIKEGLLVKLSMELSMGNIDNGDFSGTIFSGYKIENGKIAGRVKNTVISGNLYKLFTEQIEEISKEREITIFNSLLPYMLFRDMEVTS